MRQRAPQRSPYSQRLICSRLITATEQSIIGKKMLTGASRVKAQLNLVSMRTSVSQSCLVINGQKEPLKLFTTHALIKAKAQIFRDQLRSFNIQWALRRTPTATRT